MLLVRERGSIAPCYWEAVCVCMCVCVYMYEREREREREKERLSMYVIYSYGSIHIVLVF